MSVEKVAVIGSGLMGHGIAQVAAVSGQEVSLIDISDEFLKKAIQKVGDSLNRMSEKGKLKESPESILKRISTTTNTASGVSDADYVIEAAPENIDLKKKIWSEVDANTPPHTIMATNTSGLSISIIAGATKKREKLIGMHWYNPPQLMRMVEIINGKDTDDKTLQATLELCKKYGKETVIAKKDVWFFLAVRALQGWSIEAYMMYMNKEAETKEIDAVARFKVGLPMGPFELADFTGIVEVKSGGLKSVEEILKLNPEFEPWPPFLAVNRYVVKELCLPMVEKGLTGVKTGKGFYTYPEGRYVKPDITEDLANKIDPIQLLAPAINVAARCVSDGIGSIDDTNKSCKLAFGWPKGIFEFVDELGVGNIIKVLNAKKGKAPASLKDFYEPDQLLTTWK